MPVYVSAQTYRWYLLGQIDIFRQSKISLLQRAFKINLANALAEIGLLIDKRNESELDLQVNLRPILYLLIERASCGDRKRLATNR